MSIQSYTYTNGKAKPSGIRTLMYFVPVCDVLTFPPLKTAIGDKLKLNGNIVLKASKVWKKAVIISDTGKITHTPEGSRTGRAFSNSLDFKMDYSIGADEFMNNMLNFEGIILVRERVGCYRVFGNLDNTAFFEASEGTSGDAPGSEASWIAKIKDNVGEIAPIYEGTIITEISGDFNNDFNNDFN
jgi:hypothetical protein